MTTYDELYCYPDTGGVLKNHLGIRDPDLLAEKEAAIVALAMRDGLREPFEYSPDGLKAIHRQMFESLYPFAGEFRSVNLDRVGADGRPEVSFAPGHLVERVEMPRFFNDLRQDFEEHKSFENLDAETFAYRSAVYMADLNNLHPFPEGNGRVQRLLLEQMAERSGHSLRHESIRRDEWHAASVDSFGQDRYGPGGAPIRLGEHKKMSALISKAVEAHRQGLDMHEIKREAQKHLAADQDSQRQDNGHGEDV